MSEDARRRDRLIGLFLLGFMLLDPPLLLLFGGGHRLLGLPLLYVYVFAVWLLVIAAVAGIAERRSARRRRGEDG